MFRMFEGSLRTESKSASFLSIDFPLHICMLNLDARLTGLSVINRNICYVMTSIERADI